MKSNFRLLSIAAITFILPFTACEKGSLSDLADYANELTEHSDDEARFATETDEIANEGNTLLDDYQSFNGRVSNTTGTVCGATVAVDSTSNPKKITVTYNGLNCQANRSRTGIVVYSLPAGVKWKDAGAVLTATIQNLKITRVSDNKSVTISGVKTITNTTGGRLRDLATSGSITHEIRSSGLTLSFDNGTQRVWQIAKRRVYSNNNGAVITTTGLHTDGTITGIAEWGTNRFGKEFAAAITKPMVIKQDCNYWFNQQKNHEP